MTWIRLGEAVTNVIEGMTMKDTFQPKPNSGQLFKVKPEDRKSDTWPEYEGDFNTECPHCGKPALGWVKAWVREAKTGAKYFSLAFKFRQRKGDAE